MSLRRYQLWMRLVSDRPGVVYRIIDTQTADLRAQQAEVLADGYSLWGQSDDISDVEDFAREMEGQQ